MDDHVEEAADEQSQYQADDGEGKRTGLQQERDGHATSLEELWRVPIRASWPGTLHHGTEFEDGQIHGDHETAHQHAQDCHDQRLHEAGQIVHRVVHLFFVEVGHLGCHSIDRTRFLADGDHLDHDVREEPRLAHDHIQLLAGGHLVADLDSGLFVDDIAGG